MKLGLSVEGVGNTVAAFEKVRRGITNLQQGGVWRRVRERWSRILSTIFETEGGATKSGRWKKLSPAYEAVKNRKYPGKGINVRTERFVKSLTSKTGDSVYIEEPMALTLGSKVPYAGYVHAARPVIDFTKEQEDELLEPVKLRMRQLADNARLRDLKG